MRTVITISLNGNAYQIDAVGFDALRTYLQMAEQRLAGNPDQEEILADLEQAIADKCLRYLGPHKNVVSASEITEVLREMGPVDGGAAESQAQAGARASAGGAAGTFGAGPFTGGGAGVAGGASAGGAAGTFGAGPSASGAYAAGNTSNSGAPGQGIGAGSAGAATFGAGAFASGGDAGQGGAGAGAAGGGGGGWPGSADAGSSASGGPSSAWPGGSDAGSNPSGGSSDGWPGSGAGAASSGGSSDSWTGIDGDLRASGGAFGTGAPGVGGAFGPGGAPGVGGASGTGGAPGVGGSTGAGAGTGGWTNNPGTSGAWTSNPGASANNPGTNTPPLRRLYLIRDGAAIAGVCKGLAAYLNIDVSIVRILFIVLTVLTGGVWILIYLVMMFVVPYAQTSEQHAAAHGWPFNAEELIARAKAHYAEFKKSSKWERQQWRAQQRMWKTQNKQWKQQRRDWERYGSTQGFPPPPPQGWSGVQPPPPPNMSYANQVLSGVFGPLADLVGALLFVGFLFALFSIVTHHRVFWWPLPMDVPSWMGIVFLIVVYQAVVAPLRRARYSAYYGAPFANGWWAVLGALVWIAFVMAMAWQVWLHWGQITDFVQGFASTLHGVISPWHELGERKAQMPVDTGVDLLPAMPVALLSASLGAGT